MTITGSPSAGKRWGVLVVHLPWDTPWHRTVTDADEVLIWHRKCSVILVSNIWGLLSEIFLIKMEWVYYRRARIVLTAGHSDSRDLRTFLEGRVKHIQGD